MRTLLTLAAIILLILLAPTLQHTYHCSEGHPGFKNLVECFEGNR